MARLWLVVMLVAACTGPSGPDRTVARGAPVPPIVGITLDGEPLDLSSYLGRPVLVNFWGPSCVPCRDEFPLFKAKLEEHGADGLAIIGVLTFDPVAPAQAFAADYGATWPTVQDPDGAIRTAYRVAARPQTYFVDRAGILRSIQVGELTDADFERQLAMLTSS